MANTLEVSLALKASSFRSEVTAIKKDNQLLKAEFEKLASSVDSFEDTLEGKQARLKLVSKEYENAQKLVEVYSRQVDASRKAVEDASAKLKAQEAQIQSTKLQIQDYTAAYGETSDVVVALEKELDSLENEFNKQAKAVISANNQYQNMQIAVERAETEVNKLGSELKEAAIEVYGFENNVDSAKKKLVEFGVTSDDVTVKVGRVSTSLNDISKGLKTTGDAISSVGKKVSIASAGVTGLATAAINTSMSFEQSMANVAATMGMTAEEIAFGSDAFDALRDAALEAGKTTEFSASESAEALNYLALAGYSVEQSVETLPKLLTLASAAGMDLATASDLLTDGMSALQIESSQTDKVIDQLAKTAQKSNTSVEQLATGLIDVGGTALVLSGGVTEANTALGILSDNGKKGAEAGTALRNIITSLTSPTDTAAAAMKKYGVEVLDASGEMRPLVDIFGDFNTQLSDLTRAEKAAALNEIFNKTDLAAVNALMAASVANIEDLSDSFSELGIDVEASAEAINYLAATFELGEDKAEFMNEAMQEMGITADQASGVYDLLSESVENGVSRFEELSDMIENSEGAAQSMAETMRSTTAGSMKELGSKLEILAISFGDMLLPTFNEIVNKLGELVDWFSGLSESTKQTIIAVGGIIAVAGPLLVIIGTLISSLGTIVGAISAVVTSISAAGGVMAFFTTAMLPVIVTIGIVIAAVVTLAMSIKENWEAIKEATNSLLETCAPYFEQLKESFSQLWEACQDIYDTVVQPLFQIIGEVIEVCIKFCEPLFIALMTAFKVAFDTITSVWNGIGKPVFEIIMQIIQKVWDFSKPILEKFAELFKVAFQSISDVWDNILKPAFDGIVSIIGEIINAAAPFISGFVDIIIKGLDMLLTPIQWVIDKFKDLFGWIRNISSSLGNFISNLNPFSKSKSLDIDASLNTRNFAIPSIPQLSANLDINPLNDVALSGSYYTPKTVESEGLAKVAGSMSASSSNSLSLSNDYSSLEAMFDKKMSQMIAAISKIQLTSPVYLDGEEMSNRLDLISGRRLQLRERFG